MKKDEVICVQNLRKTYKVVDQAESNLRSRLLKPWTWGKADREIQALKGIDFSVKKGEIFGIIGHNGSGKSTLLDCIIGAMRPDEGSTLEARGRILKLSLGMGFDPNLTGRENIYVNGTVIGLTFKQIGERFEKIVEFSGLEKFIDTAVKNYSRGMRSRLMFSIAIHAEADIFLFDEFFGGVGDKDFRQKSSQIFEKTFLEDTTIILVSHNLDQIQKYCDRVMLLRQGEQVILDKPDQVIKVYKELPR